MPGVGDSTENKVTLHLSLSSQPPNVFPKTFQGCCIQWNKTRQSWLEVPNCLCLWLHREIEWKGSGCPLLLYLTLSNFHFTFCLRSEDCWKVLGCPLFLSWQHFPAWQDIQASQAISPSHCRLCLLMIAILPPLSSKPPLSSDYGEQMRLGHCWKHCVKRSKVFRPKHKYERTNEPFYEFLWKSLRRLLRGANWIQWPGWTQMK